MYLSSSSAAGVWFPKDRGAPALGEIIDSVGADR
jgi:hypothetical protein